MSGARDKGNNDVRTSDLLGDDYELSNEDYFTWEIQTDDSTLK